MQVRVSIDSSRVFLDFNSWICKIMLGSQVMPVLLTWNASAAFRH